MGERRAEYAESSGHETLSDADMLAFWKSYEVARRQAERPPHDRSVEALYGLKIERFLAEVSRELGV